MSETLRIDGITRGPIDGDLRGSRAVDADYDPRTLDRSGHVPTLGRPDPWDHESLVLNRTAIRPRRSAEIEPAGRAYNRDDCTHRIMLSGPCGLDGVGGVIGR